MLFRSELRAALPPRPLVRRCTCLTARHALRVDGQTGVEFGSGSSVNKSLCCIDTHKQVLLVWRHLIRGRRATEVRTLPALGFTVHAHKTRASTECLLTADLISSLITVLSRQTASFSSTVVMFASSHSHKDNMAPIGMVMPWHHPITCHQAE